MFNSHIEHTINHNDINEDVILRIEDDSNHTIIQQSVRDAIRNFNISIQIAMQEHIKS
jgi:hypothetical protein